MSERIKVHPASAPAAGEILHAEASTGGLVGRLYRTLRMLTAERWLGGVHAGLAVKSLYLQRAVRRFLRENRKTVLDAGCGPDGQLAAFLARTYPQAAVRGLDLQYAHRPDRDLPPNLCLERGDLTSLTDAGRYDLIYSIDVLEHIHDYEAVLERLARALRPGGLLFIHVPSAEQRHWFTPAARDAPNNFREHREGDDHVREGFEPAGLVTDLERLGLTVMEARWTFGAVTSLVKELFSLGERRRIPGIGFMVLLPLLITVLSEMIVPPRRGNGLCILAEKRAGSAV
jgi:2-polyprenyl-3-methyl-5-hydroxy-6-metoxy-1,4-benzoquinol methylase